MSEYKLMKWSELKATLPPDSIARIDARVRETMSRLRLSDIREAVGHTQVAIASKLDLGQASVSKIESAADMYLSTLRRYIEALGGELVVSAKFPEGTVVPIDSLSSVPRKSRRKASARAAGKKKARSLKAASLQKGKSKASVKAARSSQTRSPSQAPSQAPSQSRSNASSPTPRKR
ncbi:MAG: helix-turn-helix domain-containing protein [bacterium]